MRIAILVTCLISTLSAPIAGQVQTVQQSSMDIPRLVASAHSTVVLLKSFDRQGKILGLGSGFRIVGGRFVTNAHVVAGASRVEIFDDAGALLGIARFAEMLSTTVDLAILPAVGARSPALALASSPPPVGEQIIVIGAPEGLTNTVSDGIVSAVRKIDARQLLQITAPISPGSSGGPVLNRRGEVVGVSVSILREGQNLNFAVPVADVAALVASAAGQFEFPPSLDEVEHGSSASSSSGSSRSERSGRTVSAASMPFLSIGTDANGALSPEDRLSSGLYVDYYRITGPDGSAVSIWVGSDDFDPMVAVYRFVGDSVALVTADDDGGGGLNAKAVLHFEGGVTYFVAVSAADESHSKFGSYTVRVSPMQDSGSSSVASASDGQPRWLPVGRGQNSRVEFDRTSITSSGDQKYLAWQRTTYSTPFRDSAGNTSDVALLQYEVSCSDHRYRLRSGANYLRGEVVWSSTWVGAWDSPIPESIGEASTNAVCAYAKAHGL